MITLENNILKFPYPEDTLEAYSVSKDLFSPKVDSDVASIIKEVKYEGLEI